MSSKRCTLYVLRLKPKGYYYIGTTTREFEDRLLEHKDGYGSKWSAKHGFHSVVEVHEVSRDDASRLEDEKTIEYMRRFGHQGVRGGNFTYSKEDGATWWLPAEFQVGGKSTYGLYPASINTASAFLQNGPSHSAIRVPSQCP